MPSRSSSVRSTRAQLFAIDERRSWVRPQNVLATTIELPPNRYNAAATTEFFASAVRRVRALPGVIGAAAVTQLPLTVPGWGSDFSIDGASAGNFSVTLVHRQVTSGYFETMRVPLLRGRVFTEADRDHPTSS